MREPLAAPVPARVARFDPATQTAPGVPGFAGLRVFTDFVSEREAAALLATIERVPFAPSQSGRRKQHFGPKMNFRKRRMNAAAFRGIPAYAARLEARLRTRTRDPDLLAALVSYQTTDVFVLRYLAQDESNFDLHRDDVFAYGEAILDLSLESDSALTFLEPESRDCVRAELPARSLAVLFGAARYGWEHAVFSRDIAGRRTSITLRTLSDGLRRTAAGTAVMERARLP